MLTPRKQTERQRRLQAHRAYSRSAWGGVDKADEHIRVPRGTLTPLGVKGLACAMLESAMADHASVLRAKTRDADRRSARLWVTSTDDAPASFAWCCYAVGLDPAAARERITAGIPFQEKRSHVRRVI